MPILVFDDDPNGRAALAARRWHADHGPQDLQPLPLGYAEREHLKHQRHHKQGNASYLLALFARSLDHGAYYNCKRHPNFEDYACGVMASPYAPDFVKNDPELQKRFPPKPLPHLGPGVVWDAPKRGRPRTRLKARFA